MSLTKAHIIESVSVKNPLSSGEGVLISGFGKFFFLSSLRFKMNGKV